MTRRKTLPTRRIRLTGQDGSSRFVQAEILGPFGVHRRHDGFWTVTHVRTGSRAGTTDTRLTALAYAAALELLSVDWDADQPDYARVMREIRELQEMYCDVSVQFGKSRSAESAS